MKVLLRAITIAARVCAYAAWLAARRLGSRSGESSAHRFVALLEGLGTPFVKLGQRYAAAIWSTARLIRAVGRGL